MEVFPSCSSACGERCWQPGDLTLDTNLWMPLLPQTACHKKKIFKLESLVLEPPLWLPCAEVWEPVSLKQLSHSWGSWGKYCEGVESVGQETAHSSWHLDSITFKTQGLETTWATLPSSLWSSLPLEAQLERRERNWILVTGGAASKGQTLMTA